MFVSLERCGMQAACAENNKHSIHYIKDWVPKSSDACMRIHKFVTLCSFAVTFNHADADDTADDVDSSRGRNGPAARSSSMRDHTSYERSGDTEGGAHAGTAAGSSLKYRSMSGTQGKGGKQTCRADRQAQDATSPNHTKEPSTDACAM